MAHGNRRWSTGNESTQDKIRRYTQPYPVVTSHLQNNLSGNTYRRNSFNHPLTSIAHQQARFQHQPYSPPQQLFRDQSPAALMSKPQLNMPIFRNNDTNNSNRNVNRKRAYASSSSSQIPGDSYGHGKRKKDEEEEARRSIENNIPITIEDDKYDKLTSELISYERNHTQSKEMFDKKMRLRSALLCMVRKQFPGVSLHLVGSSCNGFASETSDADFCVMVNHFRKIDQSHEARHYLKAIERLIRPMGSLKGLQFIAAKVPILKFTDEISGCECDINVNNATGIRNTHLLRTYSKVDVRVRLLTMAIKRWAKVRNINEAKDGTLSSYSLVLMVLHYLQTGCNPPVIHSLQQKYPDFFKPDSNVDDLPMFEPADFIPRNTSKNKQSAGELMEGFFSYFGEKFKWDSQIMSVRLGCILPKKSRTEFKNKYICIEEPFELTNTARAVHQLPRFTLIKKEFQRANNCLKEDLSLSSIT